MGTTIRCTLCKEEIEATAYSDHVAEKHSSDMSATDPFMDVHSHGRTITPIRGPMNLSDYSGGKYLSASDVPTGAGVFKFRVLSFVNDPKGQSKLTMQITNTFGKELFGLNTTNIRILESLLSAEGTTDAQALIGRELECSIGKQQNLQTMQYVPSIFVIGLKPKENSKAK
jgi:hypothetical protein